MATALLMAAALALAQTEPAGPAPAPPSPGPGPGSGAVPVSAAPPPSPAAPASPSAPVASTAPQDDLESPPTVRPFEMPEAAAPAGPIPYETAEATVKAPVKVEAYHRDYEAPLDAQEAYYDAGVTSAFQAQQALRGPLEGMWIVSAADGSPLLSLVISDPGRPNAPPGGAWRDLSRAHDPDASGVIDQVAEAAASVTLQIRLKADAPPATLRLTLAADGRWRGLLLDGGPPRPVVMARKAI